MYEADAAWLAGLWDGEGSIGFSRLRRDSPWWGLQAQMSMTHRPTIERVNMLIAQMGIGVGVVTVSSNERHSNHKDAYHLRVGALWNVYLLAENLVNYSWTKYENWVLALEYIESRAEGAGGWTDGGRLRRLGRRGQPYTERELEIIDRVCAINRRTGRPADEAPRHRESASLRTHLESP